jgi:hypothetical protein
LVIETAFSLTGAKQILSHLGNTSFVQIANLEELVERDHRGLGHLAAPLEDAVPSLRDHH